MKNETVSATINATIPNLAQVTDLKTIVLYSRYKRNKAADTTGAQVSKHPAEIQVHFWPSEQELQQIAGQEWLWVIADPARKPAFAQIVAENRMIQAGRIPPSFTSIAFCAQCGWRPAEPDTPESLVGCPWCQHPDSSWRSELLNDKAYQRLMPEKYNQLLEEGRQLKRNRNETDN